MCLPREDENIQGKQENQMAGDDRIHWNVFYRWFLQTVTRHKKFILGMKA